jgi:hypothetical protein
MEDPASVDAFWHVVTELAVLSLATILVSIREDRTDETSRFVLRSNMLTRLVARVGLSSVAAEYAYGFAESIIAALVTWVLAFYLMRGVFPWNRPTD